MTPEQELGQYHASRFVLLHYESKLRAAEAEIEALRRENEEAVDLLEDVTYFHYPEWWKRRDNFLRRHYEREGSEG